jgi:predicted MFS family arabinose efflux permease
MADARGGLVLAPTRSRGWNRDQAAHLHRIRATVLLACTLGLETADLATVGATAGPLQRAMHISHVELGLVGSVSLAVGALATLPAGTLVDRVDRVRLLVASIVLWSGGILLVGASQSLMMLIGARCVLGLLSAAAWPAVASLIGDLFDRDQRSRIWAFVLAGELVGTGVGYFIGGNLAAATSWRVPFWFLALPGMALAFALGLRVTDPRRDHRADTPEDAEIPVSAAVRRVLGVRTNVVLIVSSVLGYFFFAGERMFGTEYLHGRYGLGTGVASTLLVVIGSGALIGVFAGGRIADRLLAAGHPTARMLVPAAAYVGCALLFVPGLIAASLWVAGPILFLAAAALEAAKAPSDAARLDIMQPRLWGRAEGVRTILRTLAQAAAPIAFGLVADTFGAGGGHGKISAHHAHGLEMSLLIMLVPLFGSGALLWWARDQYRRDAERASRRPVAPRRTAQTSAARAPAAVRHGAEQTRRSPQPSVADVTTARASEPLDGSGGRARRCS